ncbi:hypothetical protein [Ruminiclostridium cellobioparum]|uniref:hypothetical protein n=1 Tax=Ruminiclostridium cellobioparum TaxID=29355 RepID=UPI0028A75088|nr:hypothetical protein [Ruminiclostridium cellobioparum]
MKRIRAIFGIAYADILNRLRNTSFLIIIGLSVFISTLFVPTETSYFTVLCFGGYRGIYNSAWIGAGVALLSSIFLSLFGFYLIKNTIYKDSASNVGNIIGSTPVSNFEYCTGKFLSNITLLTIIMVIIIIVSVIMQIIRGEDCNINLHHIIFPFIYITFPTIILISSISIFFECSSLLRGSFGNIVYFFLWIILLSSIFYKKQYFDLLGGNIIISNIIVDLKKVFPDYKGSFTIVGNSDLIGTFTWDGIKINKEILIQRYILVLWSVIILIISSLMFDRFSSKYRKSETCLSSIINHEKIMSKKYRINDIKNLTCKPIFKFNFIHLIISEIKLTILGYHWFWYISTVALYILTLFAKTSTLHTLWLPLLYLWTIPLWSHIGSREYQDGVYQILNSTPYFRKYQLIASYLAAVILYLTLGSGAILRSVIQYNFFNILFIFLSALIVSALALMIGGITKSSKVFEVLFAVIWYIGPFQKTYPFDFICFSGVTNNIVVILAYLLLTITFLSISYVHRLYKVKG